MTSSRVRNGLLLLLACGLVAVAVWYFGIRPKPTTTEVEGAYAANVRGVGHMERFEYDPAVAAFQEALAKHPTWTDAKINLAIGLLNAKQDDLTEPIRLLREVLAEQPTNPRANYTLGMLLYYRGLRDEAYPHYVEVLKVDPNDAHSWMLKGMCHPNGDSSPAAITCFEKALELNPYLNTARHQLFTNARDAKARRAYLAENENLAKAFWERQFDIKYYLMGPYGEVVGRTKETHPPQAVGPLPTFVPTEGLTIQLAPGARWATAADLGQGPTGDLMRQLRSRFGATLVLFDYNGDDRTDVLLLAAVVEQGQLRDLLLRNDGEQRYTDVTAAAGLSGFRTSIGVAIADFDNDFKRDLLITGIGTQRLLRNTGKGTFEDVSKAAGLDKMLGVCLGACWIDIDQDSDLDLLLARYADTPEAALAALQGDAKAGSVEAFINRGDAPPVPEGQPMPPLKVAFQQVNQPKELLVPGQVTTFLASDIDADRDADVLVLADGKAPVGVRNERLFRFVSWQGLPKDKAAWNGGLVLDINHDGRSDWVLLPHGQRPLIYLSKPIDPSKNPADWYTPGTTNSPALKQAAAIDLDSDGWADVVGLAADGQAVLLHNDGESKLVRRDEPFGPKLPSDLLAVVATHDDGACTASVWLWSEKEGLLRRQGAPNGNQSLALELSGRFENERTRTNLDGIGVKLEALAGKLWTMQEHTTLHAGLGHSRTPIRVGIGRASSADVLRLLWPDGIPQAELNVPACALRRQKETNRIPTSCPVIFYWDGEKYVHLTDCLGGGAMGEVSADGSVRPPRPEESIKIEPGLLAPKNGKLLLKIAEPMDELTYLDRVQLLAIDHPKELRVYPDERFATAGALPTQDLLVLREPIFPTTALDHKGRDVRSLLQTRDHRYVTDFAKSTWMGYAEDHYVELDFTGRLPKLAAGQKLYLVGAGWTDYAYPETIYAATQAGVPTNAPMLERQAADGTWKPVVEIGFPAGMPKVMTMDVSQLADGSPCKIRLRTNLQVYWDQIYLAPVAEIASATKPGLARVTPLDVQSAQLVARGFMVEMRPYGPRGPIEYNDSRTETVPYTPWQGMLTKLGPVTELLQATDDRFVLCGPGDEVRLAFDAEKLPPLAEGHVRSYVLRTWGYCKDTAPTTASGGHVEPLPFRGMKNYPFLDAADRAKAAELHRAYREQWNTRPATGGPK